MADYDVLVIGAGPGGYVAAIKAAQHGRKVAIVEKDRLGGICLNWGCIPTKALLHSAELLQDMQRAEDFGIEADNVRADFAAVMERGRKVADGMAGGIEFLMKKNKVEVVKGTAKLAGGRKVAIENGDGGREITADAIIIATGHRARTFEHLPIDGEKVITYRHALALEELPRRLLCVGAGAIGMEFGYFFNAMGAEVTVVEYMDQVLPNEDADIAKIVARSFSKQGIDVRVSSEVTSLDTSGDGVVATVKSDSSEEDIEVDAVLVAVGFLANTEGLGLEEAGVELDDRGFVRVDQHNRTSADGIYAIGDVCGHQLLAHKASFEGEAAVGHIVGEPHPVEYGSVPGCTYCQPQVASVGMRAKDAEAKGYKLKVGTFQFTANGKAKALGHSEGMVKLVFDAQYDQLLGAHIVGRDATELIAELGLALQLECTAAEIMGTIHAHPTLSEAVMEAAADALGICVHQ